jgi:hypothetical protein
MLASESKGNVRLTNSYPDSSSKGRPAVYGNFLPLNGQRGSEGVPALSQRKTGSKYVRMPESSSKKANHY